MVECSDVFLVRYTPIFHSTPPMPSTPMPGTEKRIIGGGGSGGGGGFSIDLRTNMERASASDSGSGSDGEV